MNSCSTSQPRHSSNQPPHESRKILPGTPITDQQSGPRHQIVLTKHSLSPQFSTRYGHDLVNELFERLRYVQIFYHHLYLKMPLN